MMGKSKQLRLETAHMSIRNRETAGNTSFSNKLKKNTATAPPSQTLQSLPSSPYPLVITL